MHFPVNIVTVTLPQVFADLRETLISFVLIHDDRYDK